MNMWKLLGLAGLAGVAATGAVIARDERRRRAVTPDDVRARLHQRLDEAGPAPAAAAPTDRRRRFRALVRRPRTSPTA